jgi:flagella basal body P-ring formation protein FlgA
MLERNQEHPGGPGKMTELAGDAKPAIHRSKTSPVILAGDRVIVVEKTVTADVNMEGIATSPAAVGENLKVRLAVGGWMVEVVALGPGRTRIAGETAR